MADWCIAGSVGTDPEKVFSPTFVKILSRMTAKAAWMDASVQIDPPDYPDTSTIVSIVKGGETLLWLRLDGAEVVGGKRKLGTVFDNYREAMKVLGI